MRLATVTCGTILVDSIAEARAYLADERDTNDIGSTDYYEAHAGFVWDYDSNLIDRIAYNGRLESEIRGEK